VGARESEREPLIVSMTQAAKLSTSTWRVGSADERGGGPAILNRYRSLNGKSIPAWVQ